FFFFQAEDGIRDFHVTGVQTCALPIYWSVRLLPLSMVNRSIAGRIWLAAGGSHASEKRIASAAGARNVLQRSATRPSVMRKVSRSEERRVGKESRARWGGHN